MRQTRFPNSAFIALCALISPAFSQDGTTTVSTAQLQALINKVEALSAKVESQDREIAKLKAGKGAPVVIPDNFSAPIHHQKMKHDSKAVVESEVVGDPKMVIKEEKKGEWFASAEAVIVKPHFGAGNNAFVVGDQDPVIADPEFVRGVPFDWDMEVSSRYEVGYTPAHDCIGFRFRWWDFENGTDPQSSDPNLFAAAHFADEPDVGIDPVPVNNLFPAVVPRGITSYQILDTSALDFEATKRRQLGFSSLTNSVGIRLASLSDRSWYFTSDNTEIMEATNQFRGVGPTVSTRWERALNTPGDRGQISLFAGARGSLLLVSIAWPELIANS